MTIRRNSYRMRQHTELWPTLDEPADSEPASRRRRGRQEVMTPEAHPLAGLSDFQSAELSDFGPALTPV